MITWGSLNHRERQKILSELLIGKDFRTIYSYSCQRHLSNLPMYIQKIITPPPYLVGQDKKPAEES